MTFVSFYNNATLKPQGLYSCVPSFNMLRLMVIYEGRIEILQHDFQKNLDSMNTFLCGIWAKKS